jgi:methylenetetrahydrofolate reductase (NADPH)
MKISELLQSGKPLLSFEVFPPKTDATYDSIRSATEEIASLRPHFMSVTCGAGGNSPQNSGYTVDIAANLQNRFKVPSVAHVTCVASTRESILNRLYELNKAGIENIFALRGDIPKDAGDPSLWGYRHASDLVREIKAYGGFSIGGACYPEGHPESRNQADDIRYVKEKVDAGCDFLTTQMFFDNNILYNYLYKIREAGVTVPVIAGIMPVTNATQIARICMLSGCQIPQKFKAIVDHYGDDPDAMKQAGIAYATEQIIDLYANGIRAVHVYSMNKPDVAQRIRENLSAIVK